MEHKLMVSRDGEFTYPIVFYSDFTHMRESMEQAGLHCYRACIVTDSNVGALYADSLKVELEKCCHKVSIFTFPAGEANKHLETVSDLYEFLIQEEFDRKDMIFALGGGVVGDLAGFASATYLRGIPFVQIPTSLLAQVDSSVGGKTGVDFRKYKNMVGAFHQPSLVYMNLSALSTLNDEQFACGMAEILKHGLLCDNEYSIWLRKHAGEIQDKNTDALSYMIYRSCQIKSHVVEQDPTEQGIRATLNLGHTIGHAVEKLMDFSMLHGQCVALGYVAAAYISLQRGLLTTDDLFLIEKTNRLYHLPNRVKGVNPGQVLQATKKDKKMTSGNIKFILLKKPGQCIIDTTVTDEELLSGIQYIIED